VSDAPTIPDATASRPTADAEQPVSALFEVLPHVLRTLRREPALVITLTYVLVAMAGIFYDYAFYRQFDIPALSLSQISDFLGAGIQQPMAIVLVLSTFRCAGCSTGSISAAAAGARRKACGSRRRRRSIGGSGGGSRSSSA